MLLALSLQEWTALMGVFCTIITVVIVPVYKILKSKKEKHINSLKQLNKVVKKVEEVSNIIDNVNSNVSSLTDDVANLASEVKDLKRKTDIFETQQLKYMINDAFYGFDCIEDIPDEVLINASQCCDIYVSKGLNHETGARCKLIYAELERRQNKLAYHKKEGDSRE